MHYSYNVKNNNNDNFNRNIENFKSTTESRHLVSEFKSFEESVKNNTGFDYTHFLAFNSPVANELGRDMFLQESYLPEHFGHDQDAINRFVSMMETKYESTRDAMRTVLSENANLIGTSNLGSIVGLSLPVAKSIMIKNLIINTMPTMVTNNKIVNIEFERRYLYDPETGKKIDIAKEQDQIYGMIENNIDKKIIKVTKDIPLDVLTELGLGNNESITGIKVESINVTCDLLEGETEPGSGEVLTATESRTFDIHIGDQLNEGYTGTQLFKEVKFNDRAVGTFALNRNDNVLTLIGSGAINSVNVSLFKDNSNMSKSVPSVQWQLFKEMLSVEHGSKVSTSYTLESAYDHKNIHNIDLAEVIIDTTAKVLSDYKDVYVLRALENDYDNTDDRFKVYSEIDFAPSSKFAGTPDVWRQYIVSESFATIIDDVARLVNDPDFDVIVYGRPTLIEKCIKSFDGEKNTFSDRVGNLELEFSRTVVNTPTRRIHFIGSQKLQNKKDGTLNDELRVILQPRNPDRISFLLIDYQTYLGPEVRPAHAAHLPAITGFERFEFAKYEGVQAVVKILNEKGIRAGESDAKEHDSSKIITGGFINGTGFKSIEPSPKSVEAPSKK